MIRAQIKQREATKACRAVRDAGFQHFTLTFNALGLPIIRVAPTTVASATDIEDEIANWANRAED
jgi:hypothetical protein